MTDDGQLIPFSTPLPARGLSELEAVIDRGLETFVEVGRALLEINRQRLYREAGYERFETYCQERWGWSRIRAFQLMESAKVVDVIADVGAEAPTSGEESVLTTVNTAQDSGALTTVNIPANEAQARELSRLKDPTSIREVWGQVVKEHSAKVTARAIRKAVKERLGTPAPLPPSQEAETVGEIMAVVGDPSGKIARETLNLEALDAITKLQKDLERLDPAAYVPALHETERLLLAELVRDVRAWTQKVETELHQPLRLVRESDDDADLG